MSDAAVIIVGEYDQFDSDRLLQRAISKSGLIDEGVEYVAAVQGEVTGKKGATKKQIANESERVRKRIKNSGAKVAMLVGNVALQSITGSAGIKSARGRPFERDGVVYVPTVSPSYMTHDPAFEPIFHSDFELARRVLESGGVPREKSLDYIIVRTPVAVEQMLRDLKGVVSVDIETTGLYPWAPDAKINTIGFGTATRQYILPVAHSGGPHFTGEYLDDVIVACVDRLKDCVVVMQNGKFDVLWILVKFGIRFPLDFDTMLAHYILDENSPHGLKILAQAMCNAPNWDVDDDTKKGNASLERLALYQAHDLFYTRRLFYVLKRRLNDEPNAKRVFHKILMPMSGIFMEAQFDGVYIRKEQFNAAEEYLKGELDSALSKLSEYADINWGSTKQLSELLYKKFKLPIVERTKKGAASCGESALKQLDHPCVASLLRYRAARQQHSFFIEGWKPFLHRTRVGWFLHPSFKLHGTVTGRPSAENPNLFQVPRDERIRSLISAEPGWTFLEADLSQIEMRLAAEVSRDPNLLYAFTHDIDVHWLTAIREIERGAGLHDLVMKTATTWLKTNKRLSYAEAIETLLKMGPDAAAEIDKGWKEYRKKAKAINFGYLYGMWWKKFKEYARNNYDVIVTDEQAEASRDAYFHNYPALAPWHKRQKRYVRLNGYVTSLSGRRRRLPLAQLPDDVPQRREAERQSINSPIQSFANEINFMAAIQIREEYGRDKVRICGTVYDAILMRIKDEYVAEVGARLLEIMKRPALFDEFGINLTVPILADAKVGPWGSGVEFHKWLEQQNGR